MKYFDSDCVVGCYKENRERCCVVDGEVVCGDCLYGYKEVYGKCVKKCECISNCVNFSTG